jgi:hypothetical protein
MVQRVTLCMSLILYLLVRQDRKLRANFEVHLKTQFEVEHLSRRQQEESEGEEDEFFLLMT